MLRARFNCLSTFASDLASSAPIVPPPSTEAIATIAIRCFSLRPFLSFYDWEGPTKNKSFLRPGKLLRSLREGRCLAAFLIDAKTQDCRTVRVLVHLGEKGKTAAKVEYWMSSPVMVDLPDLWRNLRLLRCDAYQWIQSAH